MRHFQLLASGLQLPEHCPPVGHHDAHLAEDIGERRHQVPGFRIRQWAQVDGDVALLMPVVPAAVSCPGDRLQVPRLIALGLEDRVQQKPHCEASGRQLAQHRIDQEWHVIVQDLDDRAFRHRPLAVGGRAAGANLMPAPRLVGDELESLARVGGEPLRR
jgi:hypothetical protein